MIKLNFTKHLAEQDMIKLIQKEKGLSVEEAIKFCINEKIYNSIKENDWLSIAISLWGHADPERQWEVLDNPCIEIELEESKLNLVKEIAKENKTTNLKAVSYFIILTMEQLGYHI